MTLDSISLENERYFPNHRLDREIGLAEYEAAANRLSNDERALTWSTNISALLGTAVGYISLNSSVYVDSLKHTGIDPETFRALLLLAVVVFGYFSILHLTDLLKSLVFAERKIVVLRRMLGVSYGESTLVLPNWRLEGASNPFVLKLFRGYFSAHTFPVHVVLITTSLSIFVLSTSLSAPFGGFVEYVRLHPQRINVSLAAFWYLFGLYIFRRNLKESNENIQLIFAKFISSIFRIPLIPNFEHGIYRLRLEMAEIMRVKTDLTEAKKLTIFIEDRSFYEHRGISWRGTFRALLGRIVGENRGGGSSITQQLVRSQFIIRPSNTIRRKIVEMLLSRWIERIFTKDEILLGYLSIVRFDHGIYGFHRAYRHFFLEESKSVEKWEAFILVERLGNVRGKFLGRRVLQLLRDAIKKELISTDDAILSLRYYSNMLGHHFHLENNGLTPENVIDQLPSS